jgi:hypothetical protein
VLETSARFFKFELVPLRNKSFASFGLIREGLQICSLLVLKIVESSLTATSLKAGIKHALEHGEIVILSFSSSLARKSDGFYLGNGERTL